MQAARLRPHPTERHSINNSIIVLDWITPSVEKKKNHVPHHYATSISLFVYARLYVYTIYTHTCSFINTRANAWFYIELFSILCAGLFDRFAKMTLALEGSTRELIIVSRMTRRVLFVVDSFVVLSLALGEKRLLHFDNFSQFNTERESCKNVMLMKLTHAN